VSGRLHAKAKPGRPAAASRRPSGRATSPTRVRRSTTAKSAPARPKRSGGASNRASRSTSTRRPSVAARVAAASAAASSGPPGSSRLQTAVRTPTERAALVTRRNRFRVAVAGGIALAVLVTSFPLTVLYNQHRQLSASAAQLSQLQHQNALLAEQRQQLNSDAEVKRLAQQNYQLVQPGRALFVILPPAGQSTTAPAAPTAGDPANQPLVSPSQAPNMSPDPGLPATPVVPSTSATATGTPPSGAAHVSTGFVGRIVSSLEFWK